MAERHYIFGVRRTGKLMIDDMVTFSMLFRSADLACPKVTSTTCSLCLDVS